MNARALAAAVCFAWLCAAAIVGSWPAPAAAIGERGLVDLRAIEYTGGHAQPRPNAMKRLAWEVRQRTSVETRLEPTRVRFSDAGLFDSPFVYWSGDAAFPPLTEAEIQGLRRFVDFGGFVLVDDAAPEAGSSADSSSSTTSKAGSATFDRSVRRDLGRAFGPAALIKMPTNHVVFRSFYLVPRPVGRVEGADTLEAIERTGRAAVIYTRHDLGGALERDNLGNYAYPLSPGSNMQREMALRLGVNLVLYALCLDYKDDQVHAPFIMRRWAGGATSTP